MDSDLEHALVVLRYWFGPNLARDLNVTPVTVGDCRDPQSGRIRLASLRPPGLDYLHDCIPCVTGRLHMTQADGSG
jgi:hypothetical protein